MTLGDRVKIVWSCDNPDTNGMGVTISQVDDSKVQVKFDNGDTWWYCLDEDMLEVL